MRGANCQMISATPHPAFGHLLPQGEGHVPDSPKPPKRKSLQKGVAERGEAIER